MRRIITLLTVMAISVGPSLGQVQFSLDDAIQYAMEHATDILLAEQDILDAEGQLMEYKSIGIPKIDASANYTYYPQLATVFIPDFITPVTYSVLFEEGVLDPKPIPETAAVPAQFGTDHFVDAGVSLNSLLFDFSWLTGLKAQDLYRELVSQQLDVTEYQTRAAITRAYLAVLISEKSYELLNNNIENIERLLVETRALYETGFSEKLDVDRLDFSLENLRVEQQKVERQIEVTENLLKYQMGFPVATDIELTDEFDILTEKLAVEDIDLTSDIDFNARPEYIALSMREELNALNEKVIKASYMPVFSAKAGYAQQLGRNRLLDSEDNSWFPASYLGVSVNFPIFDGLERKAKLDRAKISREKVRTQRVDFENAMTLEVYNARIDYLNARETVLSRQDAMDLAQSIYDTTQIKYREGVGSSVELTQAESELYDAQTNFINALYDLIVAKTDLDIALGKM